MGRYAIAENYPSIRVDAFSSRIFLRGDGPGIRNCSIRAGCDRPGQHGFACYKQKEVVDISVKINFVVGDPSESEAGMSYILNVTSCGFAEEVTSRVACIVGTPRAL